MFTARAVISTPEAETGGLPPVRGQPELLSKILLQKIYAEINKCEEKREKARLDPT